MNADWAAPVRLSVVIPAYEEGDTIGGTVQRLRRELASVAARGLEIVVVDDGSTDGTAEQARAAGADQVLVLPVNRGKGAAVRAGMLSARGRTVAYTDADLSYSPSQLIGLLEQVEAGHDMVVGSRRHAEARTLVRARRLRELSGRGFNAVTSALLLRQPRDTQCGLKAFEANAARQLFRAQRLDGFAFDVELFHLAERFGLDVAEVPVIVSNRRESSVRVAADALRMVRDLVRIRWWDARGHYPAAPAEGPTSTL